MPRITKNQPGKSAGVPEHALPEVWILYFSGADKASGF